MGERPDWLPLPRERAGVRGDRRGSRSLGRATRPPDGSGPQAQPGVGCRLGQPAHLLSTVPSSPFPSFGSTPKELFMVFRELQPRWVSGGDLELSQAHHGPLADVDPGRGGQEGRKGAGTRGKSERTGNTAQLDLGHL